MARAGMRLSTRVHRLRLRRLCDIVKATRHLPGTSSPSSSPTNTPTMCLALRRESVSPAVRLPHPTDDDEKAPRHLDRPYMVSTSASRKSRKCIGWATRPVITLRLLLPTNDHHTHLLRLRIHPSANAQSQYPLRAMPPTLSCPTARSVSISRLYTTFSSGRAALDDGLVLAFPA
ncbi:hypothetical protein C8F01DRAFT_147392 [Mycena amicta]|nr:hypothetical protein C8F01DRAFT_147392 [Mycena amicta]